MLHNAVDKEIVSSRSIDGRGRSADFRPGAQSILQAATGKALVSNAGLLPRPLLALGREFFADLVRTLDPLIISISGFVLFISLGTISYLPLTTAYLVAILLSAPLTAAVFQWMGVYTERLERLTHPAVGRVLLAWAVTFALLLSMAFALKLSSSYSRTWAITWFCLASGGLIAARTIIDLRWRRFAKDGRFAKRLVVIGANQQGLDLVQYLRQREDVDFTCVGFIDDELDSKTSGNSAVPFLGNVEVLIALIQANLVDEVLIALPWNANSRIGDIVKRLSVTPVRVGLAPDQACLSLPRCGFGRIGPLPILYPVQRPISDWSYVVKLAEDRMLGVLALLLFLPPMLAISVAIKLDSPGPIFFRQRRYGYNNSYFDMWKFRTLRAQMCDSNADALVTKDDPRVTRIGRVLRRTSLDELPQIFNVLAGDMSIVGPRPHATNAKAGGTAYSDVVERYAARHRVKPGITGWAQVNGWRGETDTIDKIQRRVEHDLYYIENWSFWFDLWIILYTLKAVFDREHAY